jgi:hypothetical protein
VGAVAGGFSGSSARRQNIITQTQQQEELDRQRAAAESAQTGALQATLERDTNRLLRVFGTRALMSGGGLRAPVQAR